MSTQFAVDLVFKSQTQQLDQVASKIQKFERDLARLKGADPFQGVEDSAKSAGREIDKTADKAEKAQGSFSRMGAVLGRLALAYTAIQATKFVFAKTAELQTQTKSIEVLTGSLDKAKQIIGELQQFANITPFTSTELIETAKRLKAFGVDTEKLVDTTKRLGDVAGATGADLGGIATAYGQIQAKGRLQGEELLQLQERGINLQGELQAMYKMSGEEFRQALEKGKFSAEAVEVAVKRLTDAGGKYANGAIAQSDTLAGKLSTLQDAFETLARNIGTFFEPVFKWMLDSVTAIINRINDATVMQDEWRSRSDAERRTRSRYGIRALNPFDSEVNAYRDRLEKSLMQSNRAGRAAVSGGIAPAPSVSAGQSAVPPLLGGGTTAGGSRSSSAATRLAGPKLPEYIDKEVLRKWLISQGMGRTSGDFTNAGHRTPNHMLNAMDMGFTGSQFDHNYVQKTIEMERKLRATGAFGDQLFGPERDPRGHKDHLHVPTPGGKVKMNPALASLMGMSGGGQDGQYELAQGLMEQEQQRAETLEKMRGTSAELLANSQAQVALAEQLNPIERERLQTAEAKREIETAYAERLAELEKLGGDAAIKATLEQAKKNELLAQDLELSNQLNELKAAAISGLQEENALMEAKLAGKLEEYEIQKAINELTKQGVSQGEASALVNTNAQLKKQVEAQDKAKASAEALAGSISSALTSSLRGLIDGSMTAEEALSNAFKGIGDAFLDMAMQMIQQWLTMQIMGLVGSFFGGAAGGGGGWGGSGGSAWGGFSGAMGMNLGFEGGGYTGNAPRAGGLDGKGGFPAILHPGETVTDHRSSAARSALNGGGSGGGAPSMTLNVTATQIADDRWVKVDDLDAAMSKAARQGAAMGERRTLDRLRQSPNTRRQLGI